MQIDDLFWTEENIEHIARHGVEPEEVEAVIWDSPRIERRRGQHRYYVYGQSDGGRFLFVVLDREYDNVFYVVTARDMTVRERQYYQKRERR